MSFMRLSNNHKKVGGWIAITAAVGIGVVAISGTQGCTITTDSGNDGGFTGFDADTGDTGTTNPDTGTTNPDTGVVDNPCNECLFGLCSGQFAVCFQDTSANGCQAIYACATKTGCDTDCVTACYNAGSDSAKNAYLSLAGCDQAGECGQCQATCGVAASSCTPPDAGTEDASTEDGASPVTCDSCIASNCAAQKSTCATGSECDKYTQCLGACQDAACIAKCGTDHAQGQTDATALGTCTTSACATPCGL